MDGLNSMIKGVQLLISGALFKQKTVLFPTFNIKEHISTK